MTRKLPSAGPAVTTRLESGPVVIAVSTRERAGEFVHSLELSGTPAVVTFHADMLIYWLQTCTPSVVVLDLDFPSALEIGQRLSREGVRVVAICDDELRQLRALRAGFLEAVPRSVSADAFALRIKSLTRRDAGRPLAAVSNRALGSLQIDSQQRTAAWKDKPLELSAGPFDLLDYFANRSGIIVSKEQLMADFRWEDDNVLQQAIWQLRTSVGPNAARHIVNRRGYGYGFLPVLGEADSQPVRSVGLIS